MNIDNFLALTLILIFLWVAFWAFACIPIININKSLSKVIKGIEKDKKEGKRRENLTDSKIKLFSEKKLQDAWNSYCKRVEDLNGDSKVVDLNYYLSPENFIGKNTNRDISNVLPVMFFTISFILAISFTIIYQINIEAAIKELLLVISGSLFACIIILISHKIIIRKSGIKLMKFVELISYETGSHLLESEQLASLKLMLEKYNNNQQILFSKLDESVTDTIIKRIDPFHSSIQKLIEDYLSAISSDQQSAMENLAELFVKNTSLLYNEQLNKFSDVTMKMAVIQEKTSYSFENISEFFEKSRDAISMNIKNSAEMTDSYQKYIAQMKDMSMGIDAGINLMGKMLLYIDENNKNKDFTIEKLSEYQNEFIRVSEQSAKQINEFFSDFKDHYSSYILAMKSVSADMIKSGEFVRQSYSDATSELNSEISNVYLKFEENISDISMRLAKSISDLQEAVDELPIILKNAKQ